MAEVRVDHTLIEQVLAVLSRHVYIGDLRPTQRLPIEELQAAVAIATAERTVTNADVLVCSGCGLVVSSCPECGAATSDAVVPSTVADPDALASAISTPTSFVATDCDSEDDYPDPSCRCQHCARNRERLFEARLQQRQQPRRRRPTIPSRWVCDEGHSLRRYPDEAQYRAHRAARHNEPNIAPAAEAVDPEPSPDVFSFVRTPAYTDPVWTTVTMNRSGQPVDGV